MPRTDKKINEYPQLQFLANTDELAEKFKKLGGGRRWVRACVLGLAGSGLAGATCALP